MKVILTAFNGILRSDIRVVNGDFDKLQVRYCTAAPKYILEKNMAVPISEPVKTAIFQRTGREIKRHGGHSLYPEYALREIV